MKIKQIVRIEERKDVEVEEYCCSPMEKRLRDDDNLLFSAKYNGFFLWDNWSSHPATGPHVKIKYCPFCGEKIKIKKQK